MAEKGYQFAEITSNVEALPGGPKLVKVVFDVQEGPKVRIREVDFVGNTALGDGTLRRKMKETKQHGMFSWLTGGGTYKEAKFEEDADAVVAHYRNEGYIEARVGTPELKTLEDATDGKTRWIQVRIPVTEGRALPGRRVRLRRQHGGQVRGPAAAVQAAAGRLVQREAHPRRPAQGAGGLRRRRLLRVHRLSRTSSRSRRPTGPVAGPAEPTVNVTMQIQEGEQYFVNRITFTGNTTTRDNVIRREMRLVEGGVFNTEALKYSVRRLNQLGYFKTLEEGQGVDVKKTPNEKNKVDVTLKLEEQNRNQLTFGAGVSQFEGFFGQLSFQTANFLGRGESLTAVAAGRARARRTTRWRSPSRSCSTATSPAASTSTSAQLQLHQPVHAGVARRQPAVRVPGRRLLADVPRPTATSGSRCSTSTRPTRTRVLLAQNPFLRRLAADRAGRRRGRSARSSPSFVFNTVDNPIFPTTGRKLTASFDFAGLGRQHLLHQADARRRSQLLAAHPADVGRRPRPGPVHPALRRSTERAADLREAVPRRRVQRARLRHPQHRPARPRSPAWCSAATRACCSTPSTSIQIAGPVRLVLFYDAGQVRNYRRAASAGTKTDRAVRAAAAAAPDRSARRPALVDPIGARRRTVERHRHAKRVQDLDRRGDPLLHAGAQRAVPADLRLEPVARAACYTTTSQPAKEFTFRFAVGSTF